MHRWSDDGREHARTILQAALNAVQPQVVMRQVRLIDGSLHVPGGRVVRLRDRSVRVAAMGKAAGMMAAHAQAWGPFEEVVIAAPYEVDIPGFEAYACGHPLPDAQSVAAGERILELAQATSLDDLLIVLLSGGASALAEAPAVPLADLRRATQALLASGAPIEELNLVRRHLSRLKGGGLSEACRGELLVLAISDVDEPSALGSAPTLPDASTPAQALDALEARGLADVMPPSIRAHLASVSAREARPAAPVHVLADNETAMQAASLAAKRLGYAPRLLPRWLKGDAAERGRELGRLARELHGTALIAGGETTVQVLGQGLGGRNQELALASVDAMSGQDAVLATFGTDGVDGPTDAAGAIVDGFTLARAEALGLDVATHLTENDSHRFFAPLDDLIRTGPTGTNVRDLALLLVR